MSAFCDKPQGLHTTHRDTNTLDLAATPLLRILVVRECGGEDDAKEHSVAFSRMRLLGFVGNILLLMPMAA